MMSNLINSIGLLLDIVGASLLFYFNIPSRLDLQGGGFLMVEQTDPEEAKELARYRLLTKLGWVLVILGFALQLIGNWI